MPARVGLRLRNSHVAERGIFRYPLQPCPKIAVVCDTLRVASGCRQIPESEEVNLRSVQTETIAAPASRLLSSDLDGWTPTFPMVAFTGIRHGFLDNDDRDQVWRRFGVPVFEQLLDNDGRIFAYECEAHEGLHVDPLIRYTLSRGELLLDGRPSGIAMREMTELCGCGQPGARIIHAGLTHTLIDRRATLVLSHA